MGSDKMDTGPETVVAQLCKFDASELKWVSAGGDTVDVKLVAKPDGSWQLLLGEKPVALAEVRTVSQLGPCFFSLELAGDGGHVGLRCAEEAATARFVKEVEKCKANYERFEQYQQSSVQSYFQYYAKMGNQQNMLQDTVRTSLYRQSIIENPDDFKGLKAMDIGAGSGILSFFAAQAGASVVYAVEASSMAEMVRTFADANAAAFPGTEFKVINKPLEAITKEECNEKVDVLVSEPIGTMLFNERMIETYLCARDRYLKPGGKMFPNASDLLIAPFSDAVLHWEQTNKNGFWKNNNFYGLDLTAAVDRCTKEHFRQPIVDYINPDCLVAKPVKKRFDFQTCTVESLHRIEIPFDFEVSQPCLVHGLAGWFDALFEGTNTTVTLSTAPWCPGTHWYQIRFMLETPLAVNAGQHLEGKLLMEANNLQSYNISVSMRIQGTNILSTAEGIDLKDPEYRFFSSANAYCPPGTVSAVGAQSQAAGQTTQQYNQAHFQSTQHVPMGGPGESAGAGGAWTGAAGELSGQGQYEGYAESKDQDSVARKKPRASAPTNGAAKAAARM